MSYPRNAASPERVDIGAVIQISDGAVQTSGVAVKVLPQGGSEASGGGTPGYSADGIVTYIPTQAETDYTSFILIASKSGCIPASKTVVTSASATAGYAGTDQSKIANPTSTVTLSGTTIKNTTDVKTIVDLIYTVVQLTDADVSTMPTDVRDAILNRVLAVNHVTAGSTGLLLQFLDALVSSRLAPTVSGRTLNVSATGEGDAVLNSETLRRFVTEDTGETEAADGSVAKLAQGAGGGAGGTDWTEEQREYILEQLALLTVSGASVVVTSGVYMCARGDVEQVYGNANTATWADLNNNQNSSEITSRINYHIAIADNYIRSVLTQGAWVMPVEGDTIPAILAYNCARLAGVLLYEGRGVSDYDSKGKPIHQLSHHKNGVDSFLKSVVYGSTDLSPLVKSSTNEAPTAS